MEKYSKQSPDKVALNISDLIQTVQNIEQSDDGDSQGLSPPKYILSPKKSTPLRTITLSKTQDNKPDINDYQRRQIIIFKQALKSCGKPFPLTP